ncbi:hypothetical protein D3C73_1493550 [compost metagenome]
MEITQATAIIGVIAALSGIIIGWLGQARAVKKEERHDASSEAVLRSDVDYIKRGIDDIRLEQKSQGLRIDALSERVTRLEESSKAAHKRLDRIEEKEG